MIGYDPDEAKHIENFPESWKEIKSLEKLTGADYLVSALTLPHHSEMLLAKHVATGYLVQRKKGWDLANSLRESGNVWDLGLRMNEFATRHKLKLYPCQKILLFVGMLTGYNDDSVKVDNQSPKANVTYWMLKGALFAWRERVGVTDDITHQGLLPKYLRVLEDHAIRLHKNEIKSVASTQPPMYEELAPMQPMTRIKDARVILRSFMSERQANALWQYAEQDGLAALCMAFDPLLPKMSDRPEGIGPGFVQQNRERANAREGYVLRVIEDEYKPKEHKRIKKGGK